MQTGEARISRDNKYVQVIPVENSETLTIITAGDDQQDTCSGEIPTNTSDKLKGEAMSDCAWCGTGEGICDEHINAMFAESAAIAATGRYRAGDDEHTQAQTTGL